jgi:hypothetical protein
VYKRIAIIAAAVIAGWLLLLYLLGFALGSRQERKTTERLAESQQALVTIESSDLALIRGRWVMQGLALRHDSAIGQLSIDVAGVRCELGPLGWALVDRSCSELVVRGVRMMVSSTALFKQKRPKHKPMRTDRVVIDDAVLVFLPAALTQSTGRIEIAIEHAESGATLFRTPLSWLLTLQVLRAKISLPAGITLRLGYERGVLTASGALFGTTPVEVPLQLPAAGTARDGREEMQQLVAVGKEIGQRLVARRAADWLKAKLRAGVIVQGGSASADAGVGSQSGSGSASDGSGGRSVGSGSATDTSGGSGSGSGSASRGSAAR